MSYIKYIKDIDCEILINSDILCSVKDINKLLKKLSEKLNNLSEKRKLLFLFRLRLNLYDITTENTKQELSMPFVYR